MPFLFPRGPVEARRTLAEVYADLIATAAWPRPPIGYAGGYRDAAIGLLYLIARYYDPTTGQFLSVDPLVAQTLTPYV